MNVDQNADAPHQNNLITQSTQKDDESSHQEKLPPPSTKEQNISTRQPSNLWENNLSKDGDEIPKTMHVPLNPLPNCSSTSLSTSISQEKLKELKAKDPVWAVKILMSNRGILLDKSPNYLLKYGWELMNGNLESLIRQLKLMVLNADVFQAMENDSNVTDEIKALLKQLNVPASLE